MGSMQLKRGWIYIVKTTWGEVHEGEFKASVRSVNVFDTLPFQKAKPCPHILNEEDIDWAEEICELTSSLTEREYDYTISNLNK